MHDSDGTLLDRFIASRDEAAFRMLSERYLGLIFQTALRRTGHRQLAEEVSQNVLCAVARKAPLLANHPERLPAWLHRATLFESSKVMRSERSQQRRKQLQHPDSIPGTADDGMSMWSEAVPHLDLALDRLSESDRVVLLQHYYEQKSFPAIGGQQSRPAATVQKQCRRALAKLARILRGNGVVLSTTALASGIASECAKAAAPGLLRTAVSHAMTSSTAFASTPFTLQMVLKSKALLPVAIVLILTPLMLQQVAISKATSELENLQDTSRRAHPIGSAGRSKLVVKTRPERVTITMLQHALDEADRIGGIKYIEFSMMVDSLTPDELAILIPQALELPESFSRNSKLFTYLIKALEEVDPERVVRVVHAARPGGMRLIDDAFVKWAFADPEAAYAFYAEREQNLGEDGSSNQTFRKMEFKATMLNPLIRNGSPKARELLLKGHPAGREQDLMMALRVSGIGGPRMERPDGTAIPWIEQGYEHFIPLIREFVDEDGRKRAFETLLRTGNRRESLPEDTAWLMNQAVLDNTDRMMIAESFSEQSIGRFYNTSPAPDFDALVEETRMWLEKHASEDAESLLLDARQVAYQRAMFQASSRLKRFQQGAEYRQSDLVGTLSRKYYGEHLPEALKLAERIEDPAKRAEIMERLEKQKLHQP